MVVKLPAAGAETCYFLEKGNPNLDSKIEDTDGNACGFNNGFHRNWQDVIAWLKELGFWLTNRCTKYRNSISKKGCESLTPKQRRFCDEYLIDLNASQAAIRAGYSPKSAADIGSKNLKKDEIAASLSKAMAERSKRTGVNAERIIEELAKIAFLQTDELLDFRTGKVKLNADKCDMAAIASVKVKQTTGEDWESEEREVKFADKLKALELLGRHCGMWSGTIAPATLN